MYSTYILRSEKDGKFYIGQTSDLKQRIEFHNKGKVLSTKSRIPLKLVHHEKFQTRGEALKREKYLKSLKGGNEFKKLLTYWGVAKW